MTTQIVRMPRRPVVRQTRQGELDLTVDRQLEFDGIGMGVLSDGTPFLNQRGLARLCGVKNKYIGIISSEWKDTNPSDRTRRVREILVERGESYEFAALEASFGRQRILAYPDHICMAVLEYYAFEAELSGEDVAQKNFRRLASHGLRKFIYDKIGYSESRGADVSTIFWDRMTLIHDAPPAGFFSIFKEISTLIMTLGLNGLHIDENFVPDISVGQAWAKHWNNRGLSKSFGERATYQHNYPDYFPQSASNPQIAHCYPEGALGEFRRWFREEYIGEGRFEKYLERKVNDLLLPSGYVERAMLALLKS